MLENVDRMREGNGALLREWRREGRSRGKVGSYDEMLEYKSVFVAEG